MRAKIMLIGLGDLGGVLLDLLLRMPEPVEVLVGTRNLERDLPRCNLSQLAAEAQGSLSKVRAVKVDLEDVGQTADTLRTEVPDLVLSTATMATWWLPDLLPPEPAQAIYRAGFGVWLAVHLAPTLLLMQAVREASYRGPVLTAPYPDVVNCALGKVGLAPTCGIGNVAEIVAKLQSLAAGRLGCARNQIEVSLVAHHALVHYAYSERVWSADEPIPAFHLTIHKDGSDVTAQLNARDTMLGPISIAQGRATHRLTASVTLPLLRALLGEDRVPLHAPGVHGLPGGYPVLVSRAGVALNLQGIEQAQAIAINQQAQPFDGIEAVLADGTVIVKQENAAQLEKIIGYCPTRISLAEVQNQARELVGAYKKFAKEKGVKGL